MERQQQADENEQVVRRYDYGDEWVVVADIGVGDDRVDVDVVDGTAIVLVDDRTELEFDLPGASESVDTNNGVLIIRGSL